MSVEFTVGGELLGFCDKTFIKICPVLDRYEMVTASNLERNVRVIENIMV
jgi:hypothetical protein